MLALIFDKNSPYTLINQCFIVIAANPTYYLLLIIYYLQSSAIQTPSAFHAGVSFFVVVVLCVVRVNKSWKINLTQ